MQHCTDIPELKALIGGDATLTALSAGGKDVEGDIKALYSKLMTSEAPAVEKAVETMCDRLRKQKAEKGAKELTPEENLVLELVEKYPGDVGIFSVFFLNYVKISKEERRRFIFCAQDVPHAYLKGNCVECMAMSDNVVRAGLTPKFKDVDLLLRMLVYRDDLLDSLVNVGADYSAGGGPKNVHLYDMGESVPDFKVYEVSGPTQGLKIAKASIVFTLSGGAGGVSATMKDAGGKITGSESAKLTTGSVFFFRANTEFAFAGDEVRLFIATY